ncbi:MAG: nucleoside deaminase, partial [Pelagibacteraceae bacterium]|nr:nucleoside deaminase [Pelagibacteraceae bacterium]
LILKILNEIIPATKKSISKGNKIFGAAILNKNDLSTVIIGTNNEIINPLNHGEISTINEYFNFNLNNKTQPTDCIFLSTHEPCSLCLSAITWSGFDNIYYFFPYKKTKDLFNIPHDINILKEIFKLDNGDYNRINSYWRSYSIIDEIKKLKDSEEYNFENNIKKIYQEYVKLSKLYQENKEKNLIPLN